MTEPLMPAGAVTRCGECAVLDMPGVLVEAEDYDHDCEGGWVPYDTTACTEIVHDGHDHCPPAECFERVYPGDEVLWNRWEPVPLKVVSVHEDGAVTVGAGSARPASEFKLIVGNKPNEFRIGDMRLPGGDD